MQHEQFVNTLIERIQGCTDETLLDLIWKLLVESGY